MSTTNTNNTNRTQYYFLPSIAASLLLWSLAFPSIRIALQEDLSPINLTIIRLFLACFIFFFLLVCFPKKFSKLHRQDIIPIFILGFVGIILYHLCLNYGEQYISASAASLIVATSPIFTVIFAFFFLQEKITLKIIGGVLLALSGVVIISLFGREHQSFEILYFSGVVTTLISAIVGAVYMILGKKLLERYSGMSLTVYAFLLGSFGLLPLFGSSLIDEVTSLSLNGWGAVLFLSCCPTVIAYILWFVALEQRSASRLSVYLYIIPLLSTCFSYFFLREVITMWFLVGGFFIILGLVIVHHR